MNTSCPVDPRACCFCNIFQKSGPRAGNCELLLLPDSPCSITFTMKRSQPLWLRGIATRGHPAAPGRNGNFIQTEGTSHAENSSRNGRVLGPAECHRLRRRHLWLARLRSASFRSANIRASIRSRSRAEVNSPTKGARVCRLCEASRICPRAPLSLSLTLL